MKTSCQQEEGANVSVIPLPFWPVPRSGRLGALSLMEDRTTPLGIACLSAMAVSRHQLSPHEDVFCSWACSFCCPLSCVWDRLAPWTAWM